MDRDFLGFAHEQHSKSGGGDDTPSRGQLLYTQASGVIAIAYGIALGITFVIFLATLKFLPTGFLPPVSGIEDFFDLDAFAFAKAFLYGFVGGTLFSAFYNLLVVRWFNIFGQSRAMR